MQFTGKLASRDKISGLVRAVEFSVEGSSGRGESARKMVHGLEYLDLRLWHLRDPLRASVCVCVSYRYSDVRSGWNAF